MSGTHDLVSAVKPQTNEVLGYTITKTTKLDTFVYVCRGGSIGKASRYGLDGTGIEARWGPDFPRPSRQDPAASYQWSTLSLSRG
jgi:hypothetical protein